MAWISLAGGWSSLPFTTNTMYAVCIYKASLNGVKKIIRYFVGYYATEGGRFYLLKGSGELWGILAEMSRGK